MDIIFSVVGCNSETSSSEEERLMVTEFFAPVALVHETVFEYIDAPYSDSIMKYMEEYATAVRLEYTLLDDVAASEVALARAAVSETKDFQAPRAINFKKGKSSIDVYNLKTGMQYYFRIDVMLTDGTVLRKDGSFETKASPRLLNVDKIISTMLAISAVGRLKRGKP